MDEKPKMTSFWDTKLLKCLVKINYYYLKKNSTKRRRFASQRKPSSFFPEAQSSARPCQSNRRTDQHHERLFLGVHILASRGKTVLQVGGTNVPPKFLKIYDFLRNVPPKFLKILKFTPKIQDFFKKCPPKITFLPQNFLKF